MSVLFDAAYNGLWCGMSTLLPSGSPPANEQQQGGDTGTGTDTATAVGSAENAHTGGGETEAHVMVSAPAGLPGEEGHAKAHDVQPEGAVDGGENGAVGSAPTGHRHTDVGGDGGADHVHGEGAGSGEEDDTVAPVHPMEGHTSFEGGDGVGGDLGNQTQPSLPTHSAPTPGANAAASNSPSATSAPDHTSPSAAPIATTNTADGHNSEGMGDKSEGTPKPMETGEEGKGKEGEGNRHVCSSLCKQPLRVYALSYCLAVAVTWPCMCCFLSHSTSSSL